MTEAVLQIRSVSRQYDLSGIFGGKRILHALRDIDLTVHRGETLGLVGESGSGKSTLAKTVLGIEPTSHGDILIDGMPLASRDRLARARLIQPVFQDPYSSLNPRMTVSSIISAPLEIQGTGTARLRGDRVAELARRVGLPQHLLAAYPGQLSGGQRQRVAIARALIVEPEILICDEPTSALDVSVQAQILNLLADLKQQMNLTMILISHNLAAVRHLADRVAVMYLGQIVEVATSENLFTAPRHPYTKALLQAALPARAGARLPDLKLGSELPSPLNPPAGCTFHPRCPKADGAACSTKEPAARDTLGVFVRCHHPDYPLPETPAHADNQPVYQHSEH